MTRTFCVGGEPSGELATVFAVVAESQRAGVRAVTVGGALVLLVVVAGVALVHPSTLDALGDPPVREDLAVPPAVGGHR